jgi:hypothetical protein
MSPFAVLGGGPNGFFFVTPSIVESSRVSFPLLARFRIDAIESRRVTRIRVLGWHLMPGGGSPDNRPRGAVVDHLHAGGREARQLEARNGQERDSVPLDLTLETK